MRTGSSEAMFHILQGLKTTAQAMAVPEVVIMAAVPYIIQAPDTLMAEVTDIFDR